MSAASDNDANREQILTRKARLVARRNHRANRYLLEAPSATKTHPAIPISSSGGKRGYSAGCGQEDILD